MINKFVKEPNKLARRQGIKNMKKQLMYYLQVIDESKLSSLLEEHCNSHHFTKQNDLIRKEYERLRLRFVDYLYIIHQLLFRILYTLSR